MININVIVKKGARLPEKANKDDAGYDIFAFSKEITKQGIIRFGFIPPFPWLHNVSTVPR